MSIGIALGGGGAKGLAHIGVLEALEQNGIKPKFVAGTSIGSVVGAIYSLYGSAKNLKRHAEKMIQSKEFRNLELDKFYTETENIFERFKKELFEKFYFGKLLFKRSHSKLAVTKKLYYDIFGDKTFDDCEISFACNALDIQSGIEHIFKSGSLAEAVWASCAIPGIFPPFVKEDSIFVDGGVVDNVPISPVKEIGARIVLAVYLGGKPKFKGEPDTGFRINQRALSFMRYHLDKHILSFADFVIKPDVRQFHWADFTPIDELVQRGREAVTENMRQIKLLTSFWYEIKKILKSKF
jgi:NTE family protein